jgi:hypothetical protein
MRNANGDCIGPVVFLSMSFYCQNDSETYDPVAEEVHQSHRRNLWLKSGGTLCESKDPKAEFAGSGLGLNEAILLGRHSQAANAWFILARNSSSLITYTLIISCYSVSVPL